MGFRQMGLAAAAAALATLAAPASAQQPAETNLNWTVSGRAQPDKPLKQLCALTMSSGVDKLQISLRNTLAPNVKPEEAGRGSAFLLLTLPDKIVPDAKATVKINLRIPDEMFWDFQTAQWTVGKTTGGSIGQFVADQIDPVIQPLLRGKLFEVTVTLPDGSTKVYSLSLKGSAPAVNAFKLCLAQG